MIEAYLLKRAEVFDRHIQDADVRNREIVNLYERPRPYRFSTPAIALVGGSTVWDTQVNQESSEYADRVRDFLSPL
jgi:hypothetical protein